MKLLPHSLIAVVFAVPSVLAQAPHNVTTIVGTWSSGAQAVVTGPVSFFRGGCV
jgi:hypothetical protein